MGENVQLEMEFDEHRYECLEKEADRLGLSVPQVVERATVAWLMESADNMTFRGASASASASPKD